MLQPDSYYDPYNFEGASAVTMFLHLIQSLNNGAADGTGIKRLVDIAVNTLGPEIPSVLVEYNISVQNNLFGNYPTKGDAVPSAIFASIFGVLGLLHLLLFLMNFSRGHYFYLSLGWSFTCIMKMLGFVLRLYWGKEITDVSVGLTGSIFLILTSVLLASFDLILAQRLFTWRHPVGGSRWLFWNFMFVLYGVVIILIGATIMCAFVPYLHFLSKKSYESWKLAVGITSILVCLYTLTSLLLIILSYIFPPTKKDENLYTYQPWWIDSFKPFYFVEKGAAQKAEETFMKRNHNHRHAIRVIAATHHHYNMVEGLTNQRGDLKHNVSMGLLTITATLIFVSSVLRSVTIFQNRKQRDLSPVCDPWLMYLCWGGFEVIINVLYLVGRVDLRFYKPDRLPQIVRAIITAEQSYYPSEDEGEEGDEVSYTMSKELFTYDRPHSLISGESGAASPPYPRHEFLDKKVESDDDNISDFHF